MKKTGTKACTLVTGVAALLMAGATAASAGEITGNGTLLDVKGASICAYSGQNDGFHDPQYQHGPDDTGRVQSFGMYVKALGPMGGVPGTTCNPNSGGH